MLKAILFAAALLSPSAVSALPGKAPLAEEELAKLRGGFRLPGGMQVTLGVTTDTRLDGRLVLRTVFNVDQGVAAFRVLGNGSDGNDGVTELSPGEVGVQTRDGLIRLTGTGARFSGEALEVDHLAGQAFGSVLANGGNGRALDVLTTIDIQMSGVTPEMLGSSALRIEGLALDATARMTR